MNEKELRTEIEEIGSRIDNRIEMFYKELESTKDDLKRLALLYEELKKTSDDPVFRVGCEASILEINDRIRRKYNVDVSTAFRRFCC